MAIDRIEYDKASRLRNFYYGDEDYKLIGSINKIQCFVSVQDEVMMDVTFVSPKNSKCGYTVCEIGLTRGNDENPVWGIDITRVDSRFQGHGLAPKFYKFLISKLGITLKAGSMQSPGGRIIWTQLSNLNNVTVYAKTKNGKPYQVDSNDEGTELVSSGRYQIYDGKSETELFAFAA
jgi:hypothetical protein